MENLTIIKATETTNSQKDITAVFVEGYYDLLSMLYPYKDKLIAALLGGFSESRFYIAYFGGKVVGITACSSNTGRALRLDKDRLCANVGEEVGNFAYDAMKDEFHKPIPYSDDTGYIECVATMPEAQGKGVATKLMKHIMETEPHSKFVLDVVDTNAAARKVYEKLGFEVFDTIKEENPEVRGFNERLYMRIKKY